MRDYISREAALASMLDFADFYCDETQGAAECVREYISAIPAADVVEVVRCRDCAYCRHEDEHEHWCMGFHPGRLVTLGDYCSHGTRKEHVNGNVS